MRRLTMVATVLTAVVLLTGCAQSGADPTNEVPTEPSVLPTLPRPSGPPSSPSDPHPRDMLAGRIAGASGTCYTLINDDGESFALVGSDRPLTTGQIVRVQLNRAVTPDAVPAGCAGTPVTVVKVEIIG